MNLRFVYLRVWSMVIVVFVSAFLTAAQDKQKETANATIKGRVTWKGRGLSDCSVVTWSGPYSEVSQGAIPTRTDAEGNFRFSVTPGNHYVWINAPNYYVVADGKPSQKPVRVAVESGEERVGVDFMLERGGVVTGKVMNADNSVAIDVRVSLIPIQKPEPAFGTTSPLWTTTTTDDRGIYRLYGVPPGQYQVAAGDLSAAQNAMRGRLAVPRAFYPDSVDEAKAKAVGVVGGHEVSGVDIKLPSAKPTFTVRGKVIDGATGGSVPNISIGLAIYDGQTRIGGRGGNNPTNEKGEFQIERVPAGRYSLFVPGSSERVENYGQSEEFEVVDEDVSGIVITAGRTASVSGVVSIEGNASPQLMQLVKSIRFVAITFPKGSGSGRGSSQTFQVRDDGTFEVAGLSPGSLNINFTMRSGHNYPPLRILRLEHEGDRDSIELNPGDRLTGLRMIIVDAASGLRGRVKLIDGSSPPSFSGSAGLYLDQLTIGWTQLDSSGSFLLENLPAGSFRLVVTAVIPGTQPSRSEQNVVLNTGQISEVNILVDPKPNPAPNRP
jgi:hypothetical protein